MKSTDVGTFVKLRRQLSDEKERIEERLRRINEALGEMPLPSLSPLQGAVPPSQQIGGPHKRTMSAEARARIAAAQRKRWAASRKNAPASKQETNSPVEANGKPKRKMSAAGRKAISEAAKKRWAAARAAKI